MKQPVDSIACGQHACGIYENDPAEQFVVILPFIRDGITSGERCIYVVDDQSVDSLHHALSRAGIDVTEALNSGVLLVWTRAEWRPQGCLNSKEKATELRAAISDALRDGFTGVRFVIEMTWTLDPDIDADALAHWEATIDTVITPETPARMYCNYSKTRLQPDVIRAALATHQSALIGEDTVSNPFYESPLILDGIGNALNGHGSGRRTEWMLEQLRFSANQPPSPVTDVKEDFVSLVSHEVRNPLTTVVGLSRFLEEHWPSLDPDVVAETLRLLTRDAARLSEFIDNILVLSGNIQEPSPAEIVSISAVTNRVVERFRRRQPARSIVCELSPGLPVVRGHEGRIAQVLWNLISNADRFSDADTLITVTVEPTVEGVTIRVLDQGAGLPPAMEDAGFDLPLAEAGGRVPNNGGIGLGLIVCKRLAASMGGSVAVASRPGGPGAVAMFSVPAYATSS